jgi:SAM-dependent methyltransferase
MECLLGESLETLRGKTVLEVGAGAGRFTEYLTRYADLVVAFDLSDAIFANISLGCSNLVSAQADLWALPPMKMKFDVVYCRGVLQHTPDPARSIQLIHQFVKPAGRVFMDIYGTRHSGKLYFLTPKYLWRPIMQRVFTYESFSKFLEAHAEQMLRWRWKIKQRLPGLKKYLAEYNFLLDYILPVYDYRDLLPLSESQLVEWGKLDTLDGMFAKFDKPMGYRDVLKVLERWVV